MTNDPPRISNTPGAAPSGPLSELLRLQTDLHARLTDDLVRYFRGLQGALSPAVPGTVVRTGEGLELCAAAPPGAVAELHLRLENLQRVHCLVSVALTPLVGADGTTWYPETVPPAITRLVSPDELVELGIAVRIPDELPPGTYRGALHLQGFRGEALPIAVAVTGGAP